MEVKADQGTQEWFDARLGRATGSKFNVIMAGDKLVGWKNYLAECVSERLSGKQAETYKSKEMQWGNDYEGTARLKYLIRTDNDVTECGFFQHPTLMAGASPDGLINSDGVLEIKCPNTATHLATLHKQVIPKQYYWQVQGQMWITGRKWCDFVSFDPRITGNAQIFITRVQRNDDDIFALEHQVINFLRQVDEEVMFVKNYKGV